jgi:hypothetical protein
MGRLESSKATQLARKAISPSPWKKREDSNWARPSKTKLDHSAELFAVSSWVGCPVFAVDSVVLAGCCGLALAIALAALLPAWRAAHLPFLAACRPT